MNGAGTGATPESPHWVAPLRSGSPVLVTGVAGFIGFHLARRLLKAGVAVAGLDNLNAYYDTRLKAARLEQLAVFPGFRFEAIELGDREAVSRFFTAAAPRHVVHLAAQAGVRYSLENPFAYADSNLTGFLSVLEACRHGSVDHLVYASSSSVYGGNTRMPFSTDHCTDHPVSLYGATKKANEMMAHAYSHIFGLRATGLRFFTVYGPWGRPDMAYWKFAEAIADGRPIDIYNHGAMARDFTYVDDVIECTLRLIGRPAAPDPTFDRSDPVPCRSWAPHVVHNIGATRPEPLLDLIAALEAEIGRPAQRRFLPMQPGDVRETWADMTGLQQAVGYVPQVDLREGIARFVAWWRDWRH